VDFHHRLAENAIGEVRYSREYVVDQRLILREVRAPFIGDFVDLLAALFRSRPRVPKVFEHCQGGIDCSGTW
jgi:hypothetical protein